MEVDTENGMKRLEYLSLLSKVCEELEAYLVPADKVLAEFVTDLGRNSEKVEEFDSKLRENGAEFPEDLLSTLFTIIHAFLGPACKRKSIDKRGKYEYAGVSKKIEKESAEPRILGVFSGQDIFPMRKPFSHGLRSSPNSASLNTYRAPSSTSGITIVEEEERKKNNLLHRKRRISSPEKWEVKQLTAAGWKPADYDSEFEEDEKDVEIEIELHKEEPAFLHGGTRLSKDMSAVKIVKDPDGSLQRAAMTRSAYRKEERELREQRQKIELDSIPKDLNRPWEDPMPEPGQRRLGKELKGVWRSTCPMPEWKKDAFGKSPSLGQRSKLSIQDQRQCLPIFTLKRELINAVNDNQVLVVIGETGSGKTTQITQFLAEAGYTASGIINICVERIFHGLTL